MLPQSSFKKKFIPLLFILIFFHIKPLRSEEPQHSFAMSSKGYIAESRQSAGSFIFGMSYFNAFRKKRNAFEGRLEYRSDINLLNIKPFMGITFSSAGAFFGMAGFYYDFILWNNIIFTPRFAGGYFNKGSGIDLAYELEFRTQFEISYLLQNNTRIGFAFYHISNGNLGRSNPGAESFSFIYSLPIN